MNEWKQYDFKQKRAAILQSMAEGLTAASIASKFGISPRTVEGYVNWLKASYGAANSVQLIAIVAYYHIIDNPKPKPHDTIYS